MSENVASGMQGFCGKVCGIDGLEKGGRCSVSLFLFYEHGCFVIDGETRGHGLRYRLMRGCCDACGFVGVLRRYRYDAGDVTCLREGGSTIAMGAAHSGYRAGDTA